MSTKLGSGSVDFSSAAIACEIRPCLTSERRARIQLSGCLCVVAVGRTGPKRCLWVSHRSVTRCDRPFAALGCPESHCELSALAIEKNRSIYPHRTATCVEASEALLSPLPASCIPSLSRADDAQRLPQRIDCTLRVDALAPSAVASSTQPLRRRPSTRYLRRVGSRRTGADF